MDFLLRRVAAGLRPARRSERAALATARVAEEEEEEEEEEEDIVASSS